MRAFRLGCGVPLSVCCMWCADFGVLYLVCCFLGWCLWCAILGAQFLVCCFWVMFVVHCFWCAIFG
jgi:hypothetical protein